MILSSPYHNPLITEFYQMPDWAKLIQHDCLSTEYIHITDTNSQDILYAQVYVYSLIGTYTQLFIPRGPLLLTQNLESQYITEFWNDIQTIATKYSSIFSIIEPPIASPLYTQLWMHKTIPSILEKLPHQTHILNLTHTQEELLQAMKPKMRYNIRLAERKGVTTHTINYTHPQFESYFNAFFDLMKETSTRNHFGIHHREHYYHLLNQSLDTISLSLIVAKYQDHIIAANIILDTETQRIYLHGASSHKYRSLMAPPLLQWTSILDAKKSGKLLYDLWGTSQTKSSWKGISRFKEQFGGDVINYPQTQIAIHKPLLFSSYRLLRKIRGKSI